jgi:UDP:flavonoid glycosyltransferase YjiC (YdhE family)
MNILISTFGVRGDVQPYLALAVGLQAAMGEKIRAEDGIARAVEIVERCAAEFERRRGAAA